MDGAAVGNTNNQRADFLGRKQKASRLNQQLAVVWGEAARLQLFVIMLEDGDYVRWSNAVSSHSRVIEQDAYLTALSPDDLYFRDVPDLFDFIMNLHGKTPEREMIVAVTGQGESQNRYVIYRAWLDKRLAGAGWNQIKISEHLLV